MQGQFPPVTADLRLTWHCMWPSGCLLAFFFFFVLIPVWGSFLFACTSCSFSSVLQVMSKFGIYGVFYTDCVLLFSLFLPLKWFDPLQVCISSNHHWWVVCSLCCQPVLVLLSQAHPMSIHLCAAACLSTPLLLYQVCITPHSQMLHSAQSNYLLLLSIYSYGCAIWK